MQIASQAKSFGNVEHSADRKGNILIVDGLDAVDQTTILDIKPYVGEVKHMVEAAKIPPWVSNLGQMFQKETENIENT